MSNRIEIVQAVEWIALACTGGMVRYVSKRLESKEKFAPLRDLLFILANGLISGFSGLMGALVVSTVTEDHVYHLVAAGVFGYYGTQGIERASVYLMNRFKV